MKSTNQQAKVCENN